MSSTITQGRATYPHSPFASDHQEMENFMNSNPFNTSHKQSAMRLHPTLKRSRSAAQVENLEAHFDEDRRILREARTELPSGHQRCRDRCG